MPSAPFWKLRRLAPRAKRVLERRAGESPALGVFAPSLTPKADAFIAAYDAVAQYQPTWRKEMGEGRSAVAALDTTIRAWVPALVRDVPGFMAPSFTDSSGVPDDLIADAEALLGLVEEAVDAAGAPLAYRDTLIDVLETGTRAAQKEWQEAEAADKRFQELAAASRSTGALFDSELQLFRRSLLAVAGRSDKDYQKLRTARAAAADTEDDPNAPVAAEPVGAGEPPTSG